MPVLAVVCSITGVNMSVLAACSLNAHLRPRIVSDGYPKLATCDLRFRNFFHFHFLFSEKSSKFRYFNVLLGLCR